VAKIAVALAILLAAYSLIFSAWRNMPRRVAIYLIALATIAVATGLAVDIYHEHKAHQYQSSRASAAH